MATLSVRQRRFELPRPCGHNDLNVACLPVSTPPQQLRIAKVMQNEKL